MAAPLKINRKELSLKNSDAISQRHRRLDFLPFVLLALIIGGCANLDLSNSNEEALDGLREAGSDFSQTHPFDFYFYHADKEGAESICKDLSAYGFRIAVKEGALGGEWLCLASYTMLPSIENLTQIELLFEEMIEIHGGEYDGWETIIITK